MKTETSPLGAVARGLVAGAAGTAAMTGFQMLVARLRSQEEGGKPEQWSDAPAPAQVAKRILSGVFEKPVSLDQAPTLANIMHWLYGTGSGAVYGLVRGSSASLSPAASGSAFGASVWAMSYAQLVPMGIYEPPWKYPPNELVLDLSYHLVYGLAAGLAYDALTP